MRRGVGVIAAVTLALLAGQARAIEVEPPPPAKLRPLPPGVQAKPVSLTRIAANMAPGTIWGDEASVGSPVPIPCVVDIASHQRQWTEAMNRVALQPWDRLFSNALTAAGFSSGTDPSNLFEQRQASDLQVGALITDVRFKSCSMTTIAGDTFGGSAVMRVEWQIYSVVQNRVIARISTRGGVVVKQSAASRSVNLVQAAFVDNVARLTTNPEFRQIVTATSDGPPPPLTPTAIRLAPAKPLTVAAAAQSVVAIFAGGGHGSGFVISPDGYILTNHHVAGSNGQVRVRWADGSESVGDVVKADPGRDVALIRTTPKAAALPLRLTPALLGEPVFAIGTPLSEKFQGSVTKGIVSANRVYEGQNYIQSDVVINGGNSGGPLIDEKGSVIGVTVAGMEISGAPVGVNFFIPIGEALKALAVTPAS